MIKLTEQRWIFNTGIYPFPSFTQTFTNALFGGVSITELGQEEAAGNFYYIASGTTEKVYPQQSANWQEENARTLFINETVGVSEDFITHLRTNACCTAPMIPFRWNEKLAHTDEHITWSNMMGMDLFTSNEQTFSSMFYENGVLYYQNSTEQIGVYLQSTGWVDEGYRIINPIAVYLFQNMEVATGDWLKNNSERMEQKLYTNTYISDTIKEIRKLQPEKKGYMGGTPTPIYASQMAEKIREINHEEVYL